MVFSSFTFLMGFLPLFLAVYFLLPVRLHNGMLFLGSLIFYAWGEPVYVTLLLFSTLVDYVHGILVDRFRGRRAAKAALLSSVLINAGLLCVFKYSGLLVETWNSLTGLGIPVPGFKLPIGISFYTFQTMSYTIDVYRGKAPVQKNIIAFGAYVSMFPQLIAGPIVRYVSVQKELDQRSVCSWDIYEGLRRFLVGLGKKVLLANPFGALWNLYLGRPDVSGFGSWLGILAFGLQIYYDFSGYSDMAIGLGRMLGFSFPENFAYPYISRSITEFWRRWHMTLGTWFREYVYIPLGGNRKGRLCQLRNLLIVWALTGIWHGASWNFLLWGLYYASFLILEKLFLGKWLEKAPGVLSHGYALLVTALGWTLFAFEDLGAWAAWLVRMTGFGGMGNPSGSLWLFPAGFDLYQLMNFAPLLVLGLLGCTELPRRLGKGMLERHPWAETGCLLLLLGACVAWLAADSYNPFLYFRF